MRGRRFAAGYGTGVGQRLNDVNAQLAGSEAALTPTRSGGPSDGISPRDAGLSTVIGEDRLYPSVRSAVEHPRAAPGPTDA